MREPVFMPVKERSPFVAWVIKASPCSVSHDHFEKLKCSFEIRAVRLSVAHWWYTGKGMKATQNHTTRHLNKGWTMAITYGNIRPILP